MDALESAGSLEELRSQVDSSMDEIKEERHGIMNIGEEIEYDLNSDNNGASRYFCPQCQEEIEEAYLTLGPEPAELG